jgi:tetratricopeptide (TPR) repeat protein
MEQGLALYRRGEFDSALRYFLEVQVDSGEYPELSYYLGLCYTRLEKYDEALLYLEQAASSELDLGQQYQSRLLLGYIYAVTERFRLGEYEFDRLLQDGFDSAKVRAALAYVRYVQGHVDGAIEDLQAALELDPENANALNSLGYVLADSGIDPKKALDYCKRAVEAAPDRPAYWDSLGWALYAHGDYEGARKCLRRAKSLAPDNVEIKSHIETLEAAG